MTAALRRDEVASVDRIEWCGTEQLRQLLSSSQTRLTPRLVVSPAAVLQACCSRDISASIAAIKSDVFIGAFDLEWHILGLGCVRRPYVV